VRSPARSGEPPLGPGSVLARTYHLERVLAEGGMGVVYLAWDLLLQREVAVKVLLPKHAADLRLASLFRQEAIAMASVRHANVVQVFTAGQHGALPFFVMEYVPGQTVAGLIHESYRRGEVVGLDTVSDILDQASQGLTAMDACGLFHGDVKPANMLINSALHVTIADFGLVGSVKAPAVGGGPTTSPPSFVGGTPLYVAPELVCGSRVRPEQRHLCDVYSLGASLFEMLTGDGPFVGETVRDILRGHLFTTPPRVTDRRPDLPRELDGIVARALAKNPRRRFQRCAQLAAEVDRVVHGRPQIRNPCRTPEQRRKSPRLWAPIGPADLRSAATS